MACYVSEDRAPIQVGNQCDLGLYIEDRRRQSKLQNKTTFYSSLREKSFVFVAPLSLKPSQKILERGVYP